MNDRGLPILMYHSLDESGSVISTAPSRFEQTMARLGDAGLRAIDLVDWIAAGRPAVRHAFAITFDDGFENVLLAADVLARFNWTATVFLVSQFIGGENGWEIDSKSIPHFPLLSTRQIATLKQAGYRFGAHTRTHRRLDRLDESSLVDELVGSRDTVEQATGEPCRLFAYPYGIVTERASRIARAAFDASFGTTLARCETACRLHDLPRIDAFYFRNNKMIDRWMIRSSDYSMTIRRHLRTFRRGVDATTRVS